ncbi:hypothetical protein SFRURICE_021065 [Spodoptera frugiperda]|nr:hypothetical protein SFRURICE_021065 [Spodoptera frugiperda]
MMKSSQDYRYYYPLISYILPINKKIHCFVVIFQKKKKHSCNLPKEIVQIWLFLNRLLNKNILFALFFCIVSVETPIYCVGKYKVDTLVGKHILYIYYMKITLKAGQP